MVEQPPSLYHLSKEEMLYQLLRKERGYYKAIQEIGKEEYEKLTSHAPLSDLKPLLKKKKIILSCISEIEASMRPLKNYWQAKIDKSDSISQKIKEELDILNKLLREILQLDLLSQKMMEKHLIFLRQKNKAIDDQGSHASSDKR